MHLILASASPRRAELLTSAGFTFTVVPADVDETAHLRENVQNYALRVARAKARTVAEARREPGAIVLAADTVVVTPDGRLLGKPASRENAAEMLRVLAGTTHEVHTAVVVRRGAAEWTDVVTTQVHFLPLTQADINWYIATGEPDGKAGAYAIQGRAARFVDRIQGSWSNVVGLPIATVNRLLAEADAAPYSSS